MADKEYVLSEIRRTSKANGGLPLGSKRFSDETGIRETDWLGKYWARWGDALVEAGFSPNQFQGAYPDEFLLEKLAALTLELGHFPVVTEMKMKAHRDPEFPDPKTIRRLGGRNQLMGKLNHFSQSHPEYEAVGQFCAPVEEQQSKSQPLKHIRISGEVYLLKSGKYYKVGKTNAVGRREYELAIQLPEKVTLVHSIKTDDPSGIENYWHTRFEARRKNGEWFELTPDDIVAFKWRRFM
jgi:hypothetical protein